MPVDPAFAVSGAEWQTGSVEGAESAPAAGGFDSMLATQVDRLADVQHEAASAARELAAGTATDPAATVMAIERARLAMQLASQIRTKGVEALQDIFHTTV